MKSNDIPYGVISDIHTGAQPVEILKNELDLFIDTFRESSWKVLFFSGDLYHMKMIAHSPHMTMTLRFMAEVFKIAREKDCKIRMIKGTASHDNDQLNLISALEVALDIDIKIFNTVDTEEIFPGVNVLYIPEEYVDDMDVYYAPYYEKTYDFIIGHGLVDKAAFVAHLQESEETRKSAPIFPLKKLHEISHGPIYFGHIHKPMIIDRFRYVGSYSRWSFGESEDKGFMTGVYHPDTKEFSDLYIVNKKARKFDTITVSEDSELFKLAPQDIVVSILETVNDVKVDNVRIEIHIPRSYEMSSLLTNLLNETIKNKSIKLKIVSTFKEKMVEELREKVDQMLNKYRIIFDKSAPVEVKISEFIKLKYDVNIPVDEMANILTEKL